MLENIEGEIESRADVAARALLREHVIPTLDLLKFRGTPAERASLVEELRACCHEGAGFFYLIGHGVHEELFAEVFDMMRKCFALPLEEKQKIDKARSPHFRGWESTGSEKTQGVPDHREQIDTWTEHESDRPRPGEPLYRRLRGPNQFFEDAVLPGYKALTLQWHQRLSGICSELLSVISLALGLDCDALDERFGPADERQSLIKWIHYPPTPAGGQGVGMHQDSAFLTLLVPDHMPGLEVQLPTGELIPVQGRRGAFIVNLGEALQLMTGNYMVATPHRVITTGERYSTGFFYGPSLDADLSPLSLPKGLVGAVARSKRHKSAGTMPTKQEIDVGVRDSLAGEVRHETYGDMLWHYFSRAYPENVQRHYPMPQPSFSPERRVD